ncbi:nuclear transport factor 2 family protein [Nocardia colli]|uniref:nuclear transport factor 2 family protein n=1 Tax=Nocardia colli TaxID=2545717 RepID=UPI0035D923DB
MSEDTDFDLVRRAYAAFSAGDLDEFEKLLDPAVVHVVPGTHSMAGTFRGAAAVLANLRDTAAATDGMNVVVERLFADLGGRIIAVDRTRASRNGRTIDEIGTILFTIADGRITQLVEFYADPAVIEGFWR